ncbi:MAG: hypothetical protein LAO03_01420 [Acidobacteriia bacterium]|nr:hypothetical protein [Terriglobia bacterium]
MCVEGELFEDVFCGGAVTEERIDAACGKIMALAQSDKKEEAKKADRRLKDILLYAIASGLVADPKRCVAHYFTVIRAAFGEPTLLDQVQAQIRNEQ